MNLKLEILSSYLGDYKKEGDEYLFRCPFCQVGNTKRKLSVNIKKNIFRCWICGPKHIKVKKLIELAKLSKDTYARWLQLTGASDNIDKFEAYKNNLLNKEIDISDKLQFPHDFKILLFDYFDDENPYVKYLKNRGMTFQDFLYWKPGISKIPKFKDRIIFPSFDIKGEYNYYISRTISSYDPDKYRNSFVNKHSIIFNEHNICWNSPIYIVEGIFDAINLRLNTVILLGGELNDSSSLYEKLITHEHNIYVMLDEDAALKAEVIVKKLLKNNRKVFNVRLEEFSDPGEISIPKERMKLYIDENSTYYSSSYQYMKSKYENL